MSDTLVKVLSDSLMAKDRKVKTLIMAGYDLYTDQNGISRLGEQVIRPQHNKIVVGGAIQLLAALFGATSDLNISTLNSLMGIGENVVAPEGTLPQVALFNIGLGGCGSSYSDDMPALDQTNIVPKMIPFRIVDSLEDIEDPTKYWFAKQLENGKTAYYLKKFESTPKIHTLLKDADSSDADGTEISGNPADYDRKEGMESFVEVILRITSKDLREYFEIYDNPQYPRFNSIGLCLGKLGTIPDTGAQEYKDVIQFSVLNFSNEMLHFDKDLSIIYRVYVS